MSQSTPDTPISNNNESSTREFIVQTCTYLFSLVASYSVSLYIFMIVASIAFIHLCLLPKVWPGNTLPSIEERIRKVESFLHDETARRRNTVMTIICARGLARLGVIRARSIRLLDQHCELWSFGQAHRYIRVVYSLYQGSRRCLQDVEALLNEVEKQIYALDHAEPSCFEIKITNEDMV